MLPVAPRRGIPLLLQSFAALTTWLLNAVVFACILYPALVCLPPSWHDDALALFPHAWRGQPPEHEPPELDNETLALAAVAACKVAYLASVAPSSHRTDPAGSNPNVDADADLDADPDAASHVDATVTVSTRIPASIPNNGGAPDASTSAAAGALPAASQMENTPATVTNLACERKSLPVFDSWLRSTYGCLWRTLMADGDLDFVRTDISDATTNAQCVVGRRGTDIVVAFCGSLSPANWLRDLPFWKWRAPPGTAGSGSAHAGFLIQFLGLRAQVRTPLRPRSSRCNVMTWQSARTYSPCLGQKC